MTFGGIVSRDISYLAIDKFPDKAVKCNILGRYLFDLVHGSRCPTQS